jgi:ABC-2 type transport system permease protein
VTPRIVAATALRVLEQLRRDPRTLAMIIVVPCVLIFLLKYVLEGQEGSFDRVGGPLVGLFPLIVMFLVTSITMLRERTTGTLERLMTLPLAKLDLLLGYGIAFALVAAVQATIVSAVAFGLLGVEAAGSTIAVVLLAIANAILGMALGLLASAFAQTEFQAVQFMPAFILPQLLLCPPAPALRPVRPPGADGPGARGALLRSADELCLRRIAAGDGRRLARRPRLARRRGHHRCHPARAGARRGDAASADAVTDSVATAGRGRRPRRRSGPRRRD